MANLIIPVERRIVLSTWRRHYRGQDVFAYEGKLPEPRQVALFRSRIPLSYNRTILPRWTYVGGFPMSSHSTDTRVTDEVILLLIDIVGKDHVFVGEDRMNYGRDETPRTSPVLPDVVVRPDTTAQVSEVMKLANDRVIPVTPRGAGTGLSGGSVPIRGGIVLSLERMNRILDIDESNFTATVEPGVVLGDFHKAVEARGLYYPLYPGELTATLGGNVATNAGGMRAVKYGVTRNFLLGLEAVLPTGEIIEAGGQYVKCSTAYDLSQLIAGSEGTLAVITRVILRLIPPPGQRYVVLVPFENSDDAIDTVPLILKQRILPIGIEFMEKDVVQLTEGFRGKETPIHDFEASLIIIVEADNDDEATRISNSIGEVCVGRGAIDVYVASDDRATDILAFREKAWPAIAQSGKAEMADVVVPRHRMAEFVTKARVVGRELGITIFIVGHAGDGNVHVTPIAPDAGDSDARMVEFFKNIYTLGASMGGTISGEHGIGFVKKPYLEIAVSGAKLELMKRIKTAFDPNNIMNPGKIFDP